jgi:hypothetical protein
VGPACHLVFVIARNTEHLGNDTQRIAFGESCHQISRSQGSELVDKFFRDRTDERLKRITDGSRPKHARYQAALDPVFLAIISARRSAASR